MDKGLRYADTAEEKAALAVLPQVLKRGIEIGDHANHKNRVKQTVTFAAPVELNGTREASHRLKRTLEAAAFPSRLSPELH